MPYKRRKLVSVLMGCLLWHAWLHPAKIGYLAYNKKEVTKETAILAIPLWFISTSVAYMRLVNWVSIGSDNGLLPIWRQAIF